MSNNLIISYDLNSPGQDYSKVIDKIKTLGNWAKLQKSLWYVNSNLSSKEAASAVWAVMDNNDSLIVIDSTNNDANWYNLSPEVSSYIQEQWYK